MKSWCFRLSLVLVVAPLGCHTGDKHALGEACSAAKPCRQFLSCVAGRCEDTTPAVDGGLDVAIESVVDTESDVSDDASTPAQPDSQADGQPDNQPDSRPDGPFVSIENPPFDVAQLWPQGTLRYCWEIGAPSGGEPGSTTPASEDPAFTQVSQITGKTLVETWARVADVRFLDRGSCLSRNPVENWGTTTIYFGAGEPTAELGYARSRATRIRLDPRSQSLRADLIFAFGRALGLRANLDRGRVDLTPAQVAGEQGAYGVKPPGALVSTDGRCAAVGPGNMPTKRPLLLVECQQAAPQLWKWMGTAALMVPIENIPVCVAADGPSFSSTTGGFLETALCTADSSQAFSAQNVQWRGPGDLCVTPLEPSVTGAVLMLTPCLPIAKSRVWIFEPGRKIRHVASDLCVHGSLPQMPEGSSLRLGACSHPLAQLTDSDAGTIFDGQLCATPPPGAPEPEQTLTWQACVKTSGVAAINQRFHLSGRIAGIHDLCLAVLKESAFTDRRIGLDPCVVDAAATQEWDFYF